MEGELKRGRQRGRQSHKINKKERRTRQTHANKNNIAKKKREREREENNNSNESRGRCQLLHRKKNVKINLVNVVYLNVTILNNYTK